MYYYADYVELPKSSDDLMSNDQRNEVNKLCKHYNDKNSPHKSKGLGEWSSLGMAVISFGAAALSFAVAPLAFAGLVTAACIGAGVAMLGVSEYYRQGNRHYQWQNSEDQTIISSRQIAVSMTVIENRLKSAFNQKADTKALDRDIDFLSQFTLPENNAPYQKPLRPLI